MTRKTLTIEVPLRGAPEYESPRLAAGQVFIPKHYHDHGEMVGLLDDDHPQYLTEERGADLFFDLLSEYTEKTAGRNVGVGLALYRGKEGTELVFKTIQAGSGVEIIDTGETIVISSRAVSPTYTDWQVTFEEEDGW